jgi:hypothetical protein
MTDRIQQKEPDKSTVALSDWPLLGAANYAAEYWIDAWQRSILFLDVLRQRGNNCAEHNARKAPQRFGYASSTQSGSSRSKHQSGRYTRRELPQSGVKIASLHMSEERQWLV